MTEVIQSPRLTAGAREDHLACVGAAWKQNTVPVRQAKDRCLPAFIRGLPRVPSQWAE